MGEISVFGAWDYFSHIIRSTLARLLSFIIAILQDPHHSPRKRIQSVKGAVAEEMEQFHHIILNPFNYFEWKEHMEILIRRKFLFRVPWKLGLILMEQQRISSGITGGMRLMVSCVSAFPETFFCIQMDCYQQMKYWRKYKPYLEIQIK